MWPEIHPPHIHFNVYAFKEHSDSEYFGQANSSYHVSLSPEDLDVRAFILLVYRWSVERSSDQTEHKENKNKDHLNISVVSSND